MAVGHCLSKDAPCLIFPLVKGGSLQCRLQPTGENGLNLLRLGFSCAPVPLTWRQRLQAVCQVSHMRGSPTNLRPFALSPKAVMRARNWR